MHIRSSWLEVSIFLKISALGNFCVKGLFQLERDSYSSKMASSTGCHWESMTPYRATRLNLLNLPHLMDSVVEYCFVIVGGSYTVVITNLCAGQLRKYLSMFILSSNIIVPFLL